MIFVKIPVLKTLYLLESQSYSGNYCMRIGELAAKAGCQVETIRFYESEHLLPEARRSASNYRLYDETHLNRLKFIRNCRLLDMPLDDIRVLLQINEHDDEGAEKAHEIVRKQLAAIDTQMKVLRTLKKELKSLQERCHGHCHGEGCGLMEGLRDGEFGA